MSKTTVLLMAYGSPRNLDEVEAYFTDIRGGRTPSAQSLQELKERYRRIGGPSGLNDITGRQAAALAAELNPDRFEVVVGMKHWHPFIGDAVAKIAATGSEKVIGLVLAPHFSSKSIGEYEDKIMAARDQERADFELVMVNQWYDQPDFVKFVASSVAGGLEGWDPADGATRVFFTAHSIPSRIVEQGDPYAKQLGASADLYAAAAGISDFQIGWQSASPTGEPWIGPDILDCLEAFKAEGGRRALIAPVGFVSDHLEILFDIDVECVEKVAELGLELRRINSPNDHPEFVRALGQVVASAAMR